jgi:hypothetical protein
MRIRQANETTTITTLDTVSPTHTDGTNITAANGG